MKRRIPLARSELRRTGWLRDSRNANHVTRIANPARPRRDTGPPERVRKLVRARSGGRCEWPDCPRPACDLHHRLARKDGGRHGPMAVRLNGPAWLLHCCRVHHALVTDPVGVDRAYAEASGWLLREGADAAAVAVLTRHCPHLVLLDDDGDWQLPI